MTDDLIGRLKAGLDADEAWIRGERSPLVLERRRWMLRIVAAHREILKLADEATALDRAVDKEYATSWRDLDADPYLGDRIIRALASIYGDDPAGTA